MKNPLSFPAARPVCSFAVAGVLVLAASAAPPPPTPFPSGPLVPSGAVVPHDETPGTAPALPASFPDKFAWTLFAKVNQPAKKQVPIEGHPNLTSHNALWETWADDALTFPASPDPVQPPKWPEDGEVGVSKLMRPRAVVPTSTPAEEGADVGKLKAGGFSVPNGAAVGEEVRRNKTTFDFIVSNGLWYQEGIAKYFASAAAAAKDDVSFAGKVINFPRDSIEVKGNWIVIKEEDKARYHWNYDSHGQLLGLVAMHIISKDLPNWFWCTFEHVDNPGRGDYIGIHDSFGAEPEHTPSHTDKLAQRYPAEKLTPRVLELLEKQGFTGEWGAEWKNYRLKGSQTDFTDTAGRSAGARELGDGGGLRAHGFVHYVPFPRRRDGERDERVPVLWRAE